MRTLKLDEKQNETLGAMLKYFYEIKINPKYEKGFTCPVCFDNMTDKKRRSLKDKREHWKKVL